MHWNLVHFLESPDFPLRESTNGFLDSTSPTPELWLLAKVSELCEGWAKALGQRGSRSS